MQIFFTFTSFIPDDLSVTYSLSIHSQVICFIDSYDIIVLD